MKKICTTIAIFLLSSPAFAATSVPFQISMSEIVNVTGSPRIAVDVGGVTRYATYASGTGTSSLTFTYAAQAGDVDLDGVTLSSPIDLNGGTITDLNGNPETDLTFTVPNTSGIKIDYPSLSMDFIADADGRYTLNGTAYNDLPAFLSATGGTFARNSVGTYYDSTGTLQTSSANQPRFDHDPVTHAPKGILIEESRTNYIRNSQSTGAAIGTPGTLPTNWSGGVINANGLNYEITALNTLGTLNTFDIRIYGTATNTTPALYFDIGTQIPAVSGENFVFSFYSQLISGSTAGFLSINARLVERNSSGSIVNSGDTPFTLQSMGTIAQNKITASKTITGGTTAYIHPGILLSTTIGATVDITIRIGGAQLEKGTLATSYIPTTTAAVTRAADILTIPTGGWFDISDSTLYLHSEIFGTPSGGRFQTGFGTDANNYLGFPYTSTTTGAPAGAYYRAFGAGPIVNGSPSLSFNVPFKTAVSYSTSENILKYIKNGTLSATGTGVNSMSSASYFYVGASPFNAAPISGRIQKTKYYPTRISDTQLLLLTQ